jgi:hypothetical protein
MAEHVAETVMGRTEIRVGCIAGGRIHGQVDAPAEPAPTSLLLPAPSLFALNHPVGLAAATCRDLLERSSSTFVFQSPRNRLGILSDVMLYQSRQELSSVENER